MITFERTAKRVLIKLVLGHLDLYAHMADDFAPGARTSSRTSISASGTSASGKTRRSSACSRSYPRTA